VWSKVGRFVEGMYTVGGILTKIIFNYVINLQAALLFTCIFLWVYLMCGYNHLNIYGYFFYMLHVYVYYYFGVNPCSYTCICLFMFYIYVLAKALCVYILIACSSKKFMWHSLVGCWVCYSMFRRENMRVIWCSVAWHGWSGTLQGFSSWYFYGLAIKLVTSTNVEMVHLGVGLDLA
jgi:hypothetical protein